MKVELEISRMSDGGQKRGQLIYHNKRLLRVEGRFRKKGGKLLVKFRVIGKINLDREMRIAEWREFHKTSSGEST